jgi:deoxycytidine triphosphate deaminase
MQLTGRQIVEKKIITNCCEEGIQQQGVDVRVKSILMVDRETFGVVPKQGKTKLPGGMIEKIDDNTFFNLEPGYYEVEFEEACEIPNNMVLNYKTRSSLVRCGALIHSGQFDAGFKTQNMGAFLHVINPIKIEKGARLAQAIVSETYSVGEDDLYNGQWQGDKQRN